jgi:hypothetical protein
MSLCRRRMLRLVFVFMIAVVFVVGGLVYLGVSWSLSAERSLHANRLVVDLLADYITINKGVWPRCWQDLETLPVRQLGMFEWPTDKSEIERYVSVDFNADHNKVASDGVEGFTVVRPKGPCYEFKYYPQVERLIRIVRSNTYGSQNVVPTKNEAEK